MNNVDFSVTINVMQSPQVVFDSIANVRGWWSESVEGNTAKAGEEFLYYYKDVHICKLRIEEWIPNERIVWRVLKNHFNFTNDKTEWNDNLIIFEIRQTPQHTELQFTQQGLTAAYECYEVCRDAWTSYIQGSLTELINTGKGRPNPREGGLNEELIDKWNLPRK